jgi:TRAP transporter TAXI family solute receptor
MRRIDMWKKRAWNAPFLLLAAVVVIAAAAAMSSTEAEAAKKQLLVAGGGYTTGSWYMGSVAITEIVNSTNPDVNLTAIPGGGVANIKAVAKGRAEFAFAYLDIAYAGYKHQDQFTEDYDYEGIRGIVGFTPNALQVVVKADSDIQSIPDLVGRRVVAGYVGSGYERAFRQLLAVHDITPEDVGSGSGEYLYLSMNDAVTMMKDGLADAMVAMVAPPASYFLDLSSAMDIRVLPVAEDKIQQYIQTYPGWSEYHIPAGTYGMESGINSVSSWSGLITHKDVPDETVYKLIKAVREQIGTLEQAHPTYGKYQDETALSGVAIPLHPGAEKYWREIGVLKE